ncbi:MAG: 2Fe-2S iron-sulfur cluster-binding protein, partial [Alsobacter sp.]
MTDHLVVFTPSGRRGRFATGTPLLQAARSLGVDLDSVCGGRGICGRCQIVVAEGSFAKHGIDSGSASVTPADAVEARYADKRGPLPAGRRLGCQARLTGDAVVDVPADSQVHRQVVRKRAEERDIALDPVLRACFVTVAEPDMHDPSSDLRRLQTALAEQWGVSSSRAGLPVL